MWSVRIPSKTFFVGEYSVLRGGPALLLATRPDFHLLATDQAKGEMPFDPHSPAGRYWQDHTTELNRWKIEFQDPHQGQGGFGASSAQFLALAQLQSLAAPLEKQEILARYRGYCEQSGAPNSGADLMAQMEGGLVHFQREPFALTSTAWNLQQVDFALLRTGFKIPTHLHVRELPDFKLDVPTSIVREIQTALENGREFDVFRGVREYREWLRQHRFELASTTEILTEMQSSDLVVTAKGCGAMGADVIMALVRKGELGRFQQWASDRHLPVVATTQDLVSGVSSERLST